MNRLVALSLSVALVALLLVSGFLVLAVTRGPSATIPSPRTVVPAGSGASLAPQNVPASGPSCPTPNNNPNWASDKFFQDVRVSFYTPGSPSLSGQGFQTITCNNFLPMYTRGFWLNLSTNVPISQAIVTIWGYGWPQATNAQPAIPSFDPSQPAKVPMYVNPAPRENTASFYFDVYRFFRPGSQVFFNLTVSTTNATGGAPSQIFSAQLPYREHDTFSGGAQDNSTWKFFVDSPWPSTNFQSDIAVSTTPSTLSQPAFDPNFNQTTQVTLTAISPNGSSPLPIPKANLSLTLTGLFAGGPYGEVFAPLNSTVMQLQTPIPAYRQSTAFFQITAWLPWQGGAIDPITSPTYEFNWSKYGGWQNPAGGVSGNLVIHSNPDVTTPGLAGLNGGLLTLPTNTPVALTIHSPVQNVTISSAVVHFRYSDGFAAATGNLPMTSVDSNTSKVVFPGLPNGGILTFSILAKDVFGTPIPSGNYSYTESGALNTTLAPGYGLVFFEAIDLATGNLVPLLNFTISNFTWSESRTGLLLGFAAPTPLAGGGYLPVTFGTYIVTVRAFGQTQTATLSVSDAGPSLTVFYVASGPVPTTSWTNPPVVTVGAIAGIAAAALAYIPVTNWFKERRKKAEAEQRRITL